MMAKCLLAPAARDTVMAAKDGRFKPGDGRVDRTLEAARTRYGKGAQAISRDHPSDVGLVPCGVGDRSRKPCRNYRADVGCSFRPDAGVRPHAQLLARQMPSLRGPVALEEGPETGTAIEESDPRMPN